MKELLAATQAKVMEVAEINYVDEDWGQLDDYSPNFPVKWPCCLIDIQGATFSDLGMHKSAKPQNRQEGTATVVFTFANLKLTNSSGKAPESQKQAAWLIHDIIEKAHEVIHGFRPVQSHGKLMRTGQRKVRRDDGVQMHQVVYTIGLHNV
ncbi:hypothetical protein [Flavobacterium cerinum]|uniref:DUF3168 domain-containing protein n=1 Tax=Flavobacterium cerinum TaxID=2502784 RepID=A0A444HBS2_9FLAO|nr:hypothetical protein [Flavobacterium cerinum]RWX00931.1 hypothetical protein EPI11_07875 [Flavobacterium cerinum]